VNIERKLKQAVELQQCGRLDEAQGIFEVVLESRPADFVSLYSLGVIAAQSRQPRKALHFIDKAISVNPNYAPTWFNRGVVLRALERHDEALKSYDRALEIDPGHSEASLNRAALLGEKSSNTCTAETSFDEEIRNAIQLHQDGHLREAEAHFKRILAMKPSDFVSLYSLGVIAQQSGDPLEALHYFDTTAESNPNFAPIWYNRGAVLHGLKRNVDAMESYDRALKIDAAYSEAFVNRGAVLQEMGRHSEALENYDSLLAFDPDNDKALANKGILLTEFKRYYEAAATFERLLKVNPDYDYGQGLLCFAELHACDWHQLMKYAASISQGVTSGKRVCKSLALLAISDSSADHLHCSEIFARHMYPAKERLWRGDQYVHEKIRIAYVSPELREHPVGHLMAGIFENHDKSRFETIAISLGIDDHSTLRSRIVNSFDRFIDVQQKSTRDIAELMRSLEVDIAVDLAGYTAGSRTDIFAYRPAPIQINYLGYPGTLGVDYMDYILADRFVIPPEHHPYFSEKVVYLPDTYLPTDAKLKVADKTPLRESFDLPRDGFVFCSFNHTYKINPAIFDVWMRILERTPGSVLWLMKLNSLAECNLRKEAAARRVDPQRLIFATRVPKVEDHLARYRLADLFLDTTPYNAHTTASDALFVGLPVLTYKGRAFPGRVASGLLNAIGLPELVTCSLAEYEEQAVRLAQDESLLRGIRGRLENNRYSYPLFDTAQFCRYLESAFLTMWQRNQKGETAASFEVKPLASEYSRLERLRSGGSRLAQGSEIIGRASTSWQAESARPQFHQGIE